MQLIFLGTGPDTAIPRAGHTDPTCRDARRDGSRSRRLRSSLLVRSDNANLLIDATPDVREQLAHAGVKKVDALLLTHKHSDAASGLQYLNIRPTSVRHGITFKLTDMQITPFSVKHSLTKGFPTFGYRIENKVVYASDVARIPKNSERFIRGIPHLILDGCMWFGTQIASHLTVNETIAIAVKLKVGHLYLTQISHNYPPYHEAARAIHTYLQKQKITLPVTLAYDGLKLS